MSSPSLSTIAATIITSSSVLSVILCQISTGNFQIRKCCNYGFYFNISGNCSPVTDNVPFVKNDFFTSNAGRVFVEKLRCNETFYSLTDEDFLLGNNGEVQDLTEKTFEGDACLDFVQDEPNVTAIICYNEMDDEETKEYSMYYGKELELE